MVTYNPDFSTYTDGDNPVVADPTVWHQNWRGQWGNDTNSSGLYAGPFDDPTTQDWLAPSSYNAAGGSWGDRGAILGKPTDTGDCFAEVPHNDLLNITNSDGWIVGICMPSNAWDDTAHPTAGTGEGSTGPDSGWTVKKLVWFNTIYLCKDGAHVAQVGGQPNSRNTDQGIIRIEVDDAAKNVKVFRDDVEIIDHQEGGTMPTGRYFGMGISAKTAFENSVSWGDISSGPAPVTGTGAITEADDTAAGTGSVTTPAPPVTGTGAITEADDTAAGTGTVTDPPSVTGSGAITEADDTAAGSGTVTAPPSITGSGAITEADDTAAGTGSVAEAGAVTGSGAITEADDTAAGTGTVTAPPAITGSGAITEADDTAAGAGTVTEAGAIAGSGAITEADDTAAGTGTVSAGSPPVTGSGAITEADDTAAGTGTVTDPPPVTGSGAITEADDTATGSGLVVTSGTQGRARVQFSIPTPAPTDYVTAPNTVSGFPAVQGSLQGVYDADDGYAVDLEVDRFSVSDDWDLLALSDAGDISNQVDDLRARIEALEDGP